MNFWFSIIKDKKYLTISLVSKVLKKYSIKKY